MSYDIAIIQTIFDKEQYERFLPFIKKHTVSSITKSILDVIGSYWETYPERTTIDLEELKAFFFICKGSKLKDPHLYEAAFEALEKPLTASTKEALLTRLIEVDYATRIHDEAMGYVVSTPGKHITNIRGLLDKCDAELGRTASVTEAFVKPSLAYLDGVTLSDGLNWRLEEMNVSLGPLRKGDFVVVAARPEAGKTTFVASEATYMLPQLEEDQHVIWINNEESSKKVMMRVIQAFNSVTTKELMSDMMKWEGAFITNGGERFLVVDDDSDYNSVSRINTLLRKCKPGLIIFDQLDKVEGFKNERDDLRIGALYKWARELSKRYCPVIAVSQLDGAAEGSKWITMDHLRGSKTDKPGEADAIVMIGDARDNTTTRYITVAKNKLLGGTRSQESYRHGCFEVGIDPPRATYVSKWPKGK